jgi:hypothetical protein
MTYAYRMLPDGTGYVDATGPHRGAPLTQQDFGRTALAYAHRTLFADGKIEFKPIDPLPQSDLPSMIEIVQEMSIDEAKKRWPNMPIQKHGKGN